MGLCMIHPGLLTADLRFTGYGIYKVVAGLLCLVSVDRCLAYTVGICVALVIVSRKAGISVSAICPCRAVFFIGNLFGNGSALG